MSVLNTLKEGFAGITDSLTNNDKEINPANGEPSVGGPVIGEPVANGRNHVFDPDIYGPMKQGDLTVVGKEQDVYQEAKTAVVKQHHMEELAVKYGMSVEEVQSLIEGAANMEKIEAEGNIGAFYMDEKQRALVQEHTEYMLGYHLYVESKDSVIPESSRQAMGLASKYEAVDEKAGLEVDAYLVARESFDKMKGNIPASAYDQMVNALINSNPAIAGVIAKHFPESTEQAIVGTEVPSYESPTFGPGFGPSELPQFPNDPGFSPYEPQTPNPYPGLDPSTSPYPMYPPTDKIPTYKPGSGVPNTIIPDGKIPMTPNNPGYVPHAPSSGAISKTPSSGVIKKPRGSEFDDITNGQAVYYSDDPDVTD